MQSKQQLLASMEKLIKHIGRNRKNQFQIFNSLAKNDFRKILSNLSDINQSQTSNNHLELRIVSLNLLFELIYDSYSLKKQFCDMTAISCLPGKILLNPKLISPHSPYLKDIIFLLKQPLTPQQHGFNLWYININNPQEVHFLDYYYNDLNLDPINYLIGIIIPKTNDPSRKNQAQKSLAEKQISSFYQGEDNRENISKFNPMYNTTHQFKPSPININKNDLTIENKYALKQKNDIESFQSPRLNYNNLYLSHRDGKQDYKNNQNFGENTMQFSRKKVTNSGANRILNSSHADQQKTNSKTKYTVLGGIKNQYEYIKESEQHRARKPIISGYHY